MMQGSHDRHHGIILFFECELIIFDRTDQTKRKQFKHSIIK